MASSPKLVANVPDGGGHFRRAVGFRGLMFISLGSIIGSGWLLGALHAAQEAGPASLLSWLLAAGMLAVLALNHAELGSAYPVAGGTARFPLFAFGRTTGFTAGWAAWLQAVVIPPIEVNACLTYLNNIEWIRTNLHMLHDDGTLTGSGFAWATLLMVVFTVINSVGVRLLSESNSITMLWKTAVPVLAVLVLIPTSFHGSNFTAGGGFAPNGAHGVFAALAFGVVFALQGFEQALQLGGEARDPQRDMPRAILTSMLIGAVVYIALEITFVGSLNPANLLNGWSHPMAETDFGGPYATLALAAGAGWLAFILYVDAFISPAGTGLVYVATSSRLTYALGRENLLPSLLGKLNGRGVPFWSILLTFVVGEISFLPFPSWQSLVTVATQATAVMYAFAPVSLTALRRRNPERPRPYRMRAASVFAPAGFVFANLIVYWTGFDVLWKLLAAIAVGVVLFTVTRMVNRSTAAVPLNLRQARWIAPWLLGIGVISYLGRYGDPGGDNLSVLPEWLDLAVVIAFSLAIFYWAVNCAMDSAEVRAAVEREELELAVAPEVNLA